MPGPLHRGHERLRRFRVSLERTSYFLTLCVSGRRPVLTLPNVAEALIAEWRGCERDGHIQVRVFTVMPDHMHALVCITGRLAVSRIVGRVKTRPSRSSRLDPRRGSRTSSNIACARTSL